MASLSVIRKALKCLFPNCLIDIVIEYVPNIEITFDSLTSIAFKGIVEIEHRNDEFVYLSFPIGWHCFDPPIKVWYGHTKPRFPRFRVNFDGLPIPPAWLEDRVYTIEFDPIGQIIVSLTDH
jgi:hypothetical protein